jgi:malonyl-CoA O-methyltransferase
MGARRVLRALLGRPGGPETLEARAAYERLAAVYPPEPHNPLMQLDDAVLKELLPPVRGRRALDLGCGSGRWARRLIEGGAALVVGCDAAAAMLARARRETTAHLVRADVRALPLRDAAFDLVVCALVLGHVADLGAAVAEIARLLAPGGTAVWSDLHPAGTLAGWRRDFVDADGRPLIARQHLHLVEDHFKACRAAGLVFDDLREPLLSAASTPPEVNSGGALERGAPAPRPPGPDVLSAVERHPQRAWPALLAVRARKPA